MASSNWSCWFIILLLASLPFWKFHIGYLPYWLILLWDRIISLWCIDVTVVILCYNRLLSQIKLLVWIFCICLLSILRVQLVKQRYGIFLYNLKLYCIFCFPTKMYMYFSDFPCWLLQLVSLRKIFLVLIWIFCRYYHLRHHCYAVFCWLWYFSLVFSWKLFSPPFWYGHKIF